MAWLIKEVERLQRLAASESCAKEKAWQRINDLEKKLHIPLALLDSAEKEVSEVDELLSQSQRVSNRYFDKSVRLQGYLRDAMNALEAMPVSDENFQWEKYQRWAEGLRKETVERIRRELSI